MLNQYQDILSVYDVSEALCIGKNRVYELLEAGVLKSFRIGRVWKIPREALQEYIVTQSNLNMPFSESPGTAKAASYQLH